MTRGQYDGQEALQVPEGNDRSVTSEPDRPSLLRDTECKRCKRHLSRVLNGMFSQVS